MPSEAFLKLMASKNAARNAASVNVRGDEITKLPEMAVPIGDVTENLWLKRKIERGIVIVTALAIIIRRIKIL